MNRLAGTEDVRPTVGVGQPILAQIEAQLDTLSPDSLAAVLQVPRGEVGDDGKPILRAAIYVNRGKWSFMAWGEGELSKDPDLGFGVAVRKEFR